MARLLSIVLVLALSMSSLLANAQDLGTNYNAGDHSRSETVGPDGEVSGQYQYTGSDGKLITVKYKAGKDGFQVEGDHLPKAPQPIPAQQPQQQNQPQYNNNNYNPNPQQNFFQQPFQSQPQNNYNPQTQQQFQQQYQNFQPQQQQPQYQPFQNFPQQQQQQPNYNNQFPQSHPNSLQGPQNNYYQPQQQPYYNPNQGNGQNGNGAQVSFSQNPGQGFNYNVQG